MYETLRTALTPSEKYVLSKVRYVQEASEMRQWFDDFFRLALKVLDSQYSTLTILNQEIETIRDVATITFGQLMELEPKQYDYSIYALATLGASFAVDRIHEEHGKHKFTLPICIDASERGEIEAMKSLFKKFGLPRNESLTNWSF